MAGKKLESRMHNATMIQGQEREERRMEQLSLWQSLVLQKKYAEPFLPKAEHLARDILLSSI